MPTGFTPISIDITKVIGTGEAGTVKFYSYGPISLPGGQVVPPNPTAAGGASVTLASDGTGTVNLAPTDNPTHLGYGSRYVVKYVGVADTAERTLGSIQVTTSTTALDLVDLLTAGLTAAAASTPDPAKTWYTAATTAAMQALRNLNNGDRVFVDGKGVYRTEVPPVTTAQGYLAITSTDGLARFVLEEDGADYRPIFHVKQYGALWNGVADDTAAVQAACTAAAAAGGVVYFPDGTGIVGAVHITGNLTLRGSRATTIQAKDYGTPFTADQASPYTGDVSGQGMFYCSTSESVIDLDVEHLTFSRPGANCSKYAFWFPATSPRNSNLNFRSCTFSKIGVAFAPSTDGLQMVGCVIKDLWQDHTRNSGAPGVNDYLDVIQAIECESSTNILVADNRASNIWSFCYFNGGSSAGYGDGTATSTIIRNNVVDSTADTCFFVRATAGTFENLRYEGNIVTNCGKTPIKAEINNNSGTNQFRNVVATGNELRDWGRYAGGEAMLITGSLTTQTSPLSLAAIITNNVAYAQTYGTSFVSAINWDSIDVSHNRVNGATLGSISYANNVTVQGNYATLADDTTALTTYGLTGFICDGNNVVGNYDGPVLGYFDQTYNTTLTNNIATNNAAALTSSNYVARFNNTGGGGAGTNCKYGVITGNFLYIPNVAFSDALGTTAKPFYFPDSFVTTFALANNAVRDSGGFNFQGAMLGGIANLGYYYTTPGTAKTTDYAAITVNNGIGSGSGSFGAGPFVDISSDQANIGGAKTWLGNQTIDGFASQKYLAFRLGFAPTAAGGTGLAALNLTGNWDAFGVYGHSGVQLLVGQSAKVDVSATITNIKTAATNLDGYITVSGNTNSGVISGTGSPEGVVTSSIGSLYMRIDGGAGTSLYVKESGNGTNTGWVAK